MNKAYQVSYFSLVAIRKQRSCTFFISQMISIYYRTLYISAGVIIWRSLLSLLFSSYYQAQAFLVTVVILGDLKGCCADLVRCGVGWNVIALVMIHVLIVNILRFYLFWGSDVFDETYR